MWLEFLFASVLPLVLLIRGQQSSITITRISPNDIVNGGIICPNLYPVEITCIGVEVTFLQWQRNGENIGGSLTRAFSSGDVLEAEPFTLILDSISTSNTVANMTSRLMANISALNIGDIIGCTDSSMPDTRTLDYILRGHPHEVPTNYSVSLETGSTTVDISITWDSAFNTASNVTSYRVVTGGGVASCPTSCDPSGPCRCTGLGIGENTTITITAINCGNQMGPPAPILTRPRVPDTPSECSALPVYSSAGDLTAVNLTWAIVDNPPEFQPGVNQDITHYFISVGMMDSMAIPAGVACPTSTCFHNYSIQASSVSNSPLSVSVFAVNIIGQGQMCTPQTEIDTRNQVFSVSLDTTNIENQTIACSLLSGKAGIFECEFCYSAGDSCQNLTCISAARTPTLLPSLTEPTYCYRAIARVNGMAVAVIEDVFNTACPTDVLGTTAIDEPNNGRYSSDSMGSVSIPNGLGCYNGQRRGALAYYQCDKWYRLSGNDSRTCMGDGNWDGEVPECRLNGGNIALLVLSILFWLLSVFLTVIGCVALKKEISCKQRSLLNFQNIPSWSKITYVVLLAVEILFLAVVLPLWISAGAIPDSQNSGSQQTSLLIAAFALALPWIILVLVFLCVMSTCLEDGQKSKESKMSDTTTIKTPLPPVYAVPDKSKKKRPPENGEHKPDPDQTDTGKSKGVTVNKKAKGNKKTSENIELPSYNKLEGPGRHTGRPAPKETVPAESYDVLNAEGVYMPGEPHHENAEYSEVSNRSSKKKLLSRSKDN